MQNILRIAIIGPEATGKTTLTQSLNRYFQDRDFVSIATEEYARKYFEQKKLPADHVLSAKQMREVMKGQREAEQKAVASIHASRGVVWIDASTVHGPLYAGMKHHTPKGETKSVLAFDLYDVDQEVMDYGRKGSYDAFILCMPHQDLGWQNDGLRSMPELADRIAFAEACAAFVERFYPYAPVIAIDAGSWQEREVQTFGQIKDWFQ